MATDKFVDAEVYTQKVQIEAKYIRDHAFHQKDALKGKSPRQELPIRAYRSDIPLELTDEDPLTAIEAEISPVDRELREDYRKTKLQEFGDRVKRLLSFGRAPKETDLPLPTYDVESTVEAYLVATMQEQFQTKPFYIKPSVFDAIFVTETTALRQAIQERKVTDEDTLHKYMNRYAVPRIETIIEAEKHLAERATASKQMKDDAAKDVAVAYH